MLVFVRLSRCSSIKFTGVRPGLAKRIEVGGVDGMGGGGVYCSEGRSNCKATLLVTMEFL